MSGAGSPVGDGRAARWMLPLGVAALAGVAAWFARHGLVEPADLTASCDATPWLDAPCSLRTLVVQAFIDQRIGLVALGLALLATFLRRPALAWLGLAAGAAGLVLYSAAPSAAAVLLSALVCVRPGPPGRPSLPAGPMR